MSTARCSGGLLLPIHRSTRKAQSPCKCSYLAVPPRPLPPENLFQCLSVPPSPRSPSHTSSAHQLLHLLPLCTGKCGISCAETSFFGFGTTSKHNLPPHAQVHLHRHATAHNVRLPDPCIQRLWRECVHQSTPDDGSCQRRHSRTSCRPLQRRLGNTEMGRALRRDCQAADAADAVRRHRC
jgi:hypothetical protein